MNGFVVLVAKWYKIVLRSDLTEVLLPKMDN